ncbi:putative uncharacterized protein, partial [Waddlia chondrophila 2032/99]
EEDLFVFLLLAAGWVSVYGDHYCVPRGPLKPCTWNASLRSGVEWMWYPDRRQNDYVSSIPLIETTNVSSNTSTEFTLGEEVLTVLISPIALVSGDANLVVEDSNGNVLLDGTVVNGNFEGEIVLEGEPFVLELSLDLTVPNALSVGELVSSVRTPRFSDQFSIPWTVVGEFGYALTCNTEIFADLHYGGASGRSLGYSIGFSAAEGSEELWKITESYTDLQYFGGTIGMRYYFNSICCNFRWKRPSLLKHLIAREEEMYRRKRGLITIPITSFTAVFNWDLA